MIISSTFSYLFFHWRCFNVSLFRQCSIVVLRCSTVFPLFRGCSVVLVVFRYSGVIPSFSGCSVFRWCSVVPSFRGCSVFRCSWFYSMPLMLCINYERLVPEFVYISVRMRYFLAGKYKHKLRGESA